MSQTEKDLQDLDRWADQWEKAQADGVFEDAPNHFNPSPQTSDPSFFGPVDAENSSEVKDCDADYWNSVYQMSSHSGDAPDVVAGAEEQLLQEANAEETEVAQVAKAIAQSPNPIRQASVGKDQELSPQPLGLTFTEEDIEKLVELKLQLHNAKALLASYDAENKSTKAQESKVATLTAKMDELSDAMSQAFPLQISPQGD